MIYLIFNFPFEFRMKYFDFDNNLETQKIQEKFFSPKLDDPVGVQSGGWGADEGLPGRVQRGRTPPMAPVFWWERNRGDSEVLKLKSFVF